MQLAIFFTLSSLSTNYLIKIRVPSYSYIMKPDYMSLECSFDRFYDALTPSRFILDSLAVFSFSSASMSFRKTSSSPSKLLSSFSTLSNVCWASSKLFYISTFRSLNDAITLLMVASFLSRNSWSSLSLPFLSGNLVIVPEESMNYPFVVMTLYLFSS